MDLTTFIYSEEILLKTNTFYVVIIIIINTHIRYSCNAVFISASGSRRAIDKCPIKNDPFGPGIRLANITFLLPFKNSTVAIIVVRTPATAVNIK